LRKDKARTYVTSQADRISPQINADFHRLERSDKFLAEIRSSKQTQTKGKRKKARRADTGVRPYQKRMGRAIGEDEYTTYCMGKWGCIIVSVSET
jgi:hypothetical protein